MRQRKDSSHRISKVVAEPGKVMRDMRMRYASEDWNPGPVATYFTAKAKTFDCHLCGNEVGGHLKRQMFIDGERQEVCLRCANRAA